MGFEVWYHVYIDKDDDKTHGDAEKLTKKGPIKETRFQLPSLKDHKGKYFVGIEALVYKTKDGGRGRMVEKSEISWSSSKSNTKKKPFGVKIK